jgi:RNA polymerase sigma factor (sigma-70 family)
MQDTESALSEEQVERLRGHLVASVRRSCPGWLASQIEDIVQAALIKLVDIHGRSGGNVVLSPSYVKRAAFTATMDEIRRCLHRREVQQDDAEPFERLPARAPHPEGALAASEIAAGIHDCLKGLVVSRRLAVVSYLQGYSVPEAARFLGWTGKKVEHLVLRGLRDLRACLTSKGLAP